MYNRKKMFIRRRPASFQHVRTFDARQKLQTKRTGVVQDARARLTRKNKVVDARQKIALKKQTKVQQQQGQAKQLLEKALSELEQQRVNLQQQLGQQKSPSTSSAKFLPQPQQQKGLVQPLQRGVALPAQSQKPSVLSRLQPRLGSAGRLPTTPAGGPADMRQRIELSRAKQQQQKTAAAASATQIQSNTFSAQRRNGASDGGVVKTSGLTFNKTSGLTLHAGSIQRVISGHQPAVSAKVMPVRPAVKRSGLQMDQMSTLAVPPVKIHRQVANEESFTTAAAAVATEYVSPLEGHRVVVSNLESSVSQEDIIELFGAVGALKKARVVKPGFGEVVFVDLDAAERAVKKYHLRELDGRPMSVVLQSRSKNSSTLSIKQSAMKTTDDIALPLRSSTSSVSNVVDLDIDIVHRALFKTSTQAETVTKRSHPVNFTVHM